jgi:hypothetical protein
MTFADNDYFSNRVLTKKFFYREDYDAMRLEKTVGCEVQWKSAAKNATIELVRREVQAPRRARGRGGRGRGGGRNAPTFETVEEPRASFFRFFEMHDEETVEDEEELVRVACGGAAGGDVRAAFRRR